MTSKKMQQHRRMCTIYVSFVLLLVTLSIAFRNSYRRNYPLSVDCTGENCSEMEMMAASFFTVCLVAFSFGVLVGYVIAVSGGVTLNGRILILNNQNSRFCAKEVSNDSILLQTGQTFLPAAAKSAQKDSNELIFLPHLRRFDLTNPSWQAVDVSCSKFCESHQQQAFTVQRKPAVSGQPIGDEAKDLPCLPETERRLSVRDRINLFERMIKNGANRTEIVAPRVEPKKRKKEDWVQTVVDSLQGLSSALNTRFEDKSVACCLRYCYDHRYKITVLIEDLLVTHNRSS